ncbi:MAG: VOC family protein [Alphaproteobacteria bacterium]
MHVQPYLFFEGRCEEALDFYTSAIGAKVEAMMRYADMPPGAEGPQAPKDKVMHAAFSLGDTTVMCSDGMCSGKPSFAGVSLSVTASDKAEAEKLFGALSDGGQVQMPLAETFFSPAFGSVADKFGVSWMVMVMPEEG